MQTMYARLKGKPQRLELPSPVDEILPGIRWGRFDELFTPAFWRGQAWQHDVLGTYHRYRLGRTLQEETAACLLGGYGMKAELGLAAYHRLRDARLLEDTPSAAILEAELARPFLLRGVPRKYRFPRQKAQYLAGCLRALAGFDEPPSDLTLRDRLQALPGIGPKTASWIVRNYRGSDSVAIIDIHILRAGQTIGLFAETEIPARHYSVLERKFLTFAQAVETRASVLDNLMWDYMRTLSRYILRPTQSTQPSRQLDMPLLVEAAD
jgi:thermostable 8-oxoguanine DNA glycosylase